MNAHDIALPWAALLGAVIGVLLFGPLRRWVLTLRRTLQQRRRQRGAQRRGAGPLLLIFATLHPAPWLLLVGLPYAAYALWADPLRALWASVLGGAILVPAGVVLYEAWHRRRVTAPRRSVPGSPDE